MQLPAQQQAQVEGSIIAYPDLPILIYDNSEPLARTQKHASAMVRKVGYGFLKGLRL